MCCQCFHSKCFRRVMAAVENVDAELLRQRVSPVRAFAGDKRVHTFIGCEFQVATRAAGYYANTPTNFSTSGNDAGFGAGCLFEPFGQFRTGNCHPRLETDGLAMGQKERFQVSEAEGGAELRVVAQFGMRVEWQM